MRSTGTTGVGRLGVAAGLLLLLGTVAALSAGPIVAGPGQAVIYVDRDAVGTPDGSSWPNAFPQLYDALDAALGYLPDTPVAVVVAAGTYNLETAATPFDVRTGMAVYGGWAGTETGAALDPDRRNLALNPTILDAAGGYRVVELAGGRLDGCTVQNGNADFAVAPLARVYSAPNGGGVYVTATATLANCVIRGNTATDYHEAGSGGGLGGGVYVTAADLTMTNCRVTGNRAEFGGGLAAEYSTVILSDCQLEANDATSTAADHGGRGGGSYVVGGTLTIEASGSLTATAPSISGNYADHEGGGLAAAADAAVYVAAGTGGDAAGGACADAGADAPVPALPLVTVATIGGNVALDAGGGVMLTTGAHAEIHACALAGNVAGNERYGEDNWFEPAGGLPPYGGGVAVAAATATLDGCAVSGNWAGWGGGLAVVQDGTVEIRDGELSRNLAAGGTTAVTGDVLAARYRAAGLGGGVLSRDGGAVYLLGQTTLADNAATGASELRLEDSYNGVTYTYAAADATGGGLGVGADGYAGVNYLAGPPAADDLVQFAGNRADYGGGLGVLLGYARVYGTVFTGNAASCGGGASLVAHGSTEPATAADVTACTFAANTATAQGAGVYQGVVPWLPGRELVAYVASHPACDLFDTGGGGALLSVVTGSPFAGFDAVVYDQCTFTGNAALGNGGGLFAVPAWQAAGFAYGCAAQVTGGSVQQNSAAANGGGASFGHLEALAGPQLFDLAGVHGPGGAPAATGGVSACRLLNNTAAGTGGAVAAGPATLAQFTDALVGAAPAPRPVSRPAPVATLTLVNAVLLGNHAGQDGGAVAVNGTTLSLVNCSLTKNTAAGKGGAVFASGAAVPILNAILWDDQAAAGAEIYNLGAYTTVQSSDVAGWTTVWPLALGLDLGGNRSADPLFADVAGANLRLLTGSPAVDAGVAVGLEAGSAPTRDLDGTERPQWVLASPPSPDRWDLGAYEMAYVAPPGGTSRTAIAPTGVNFGYVVTMYGRRLRTIAIANPGVVPGPTRGAPPPPANLRLDSWTIAGNDAKYFHLVSPPAVTDLAPGTQTTLDLAFVPERLGVCRAELRVVNNSQFNPLTINLRGVGYVLKDNDGCVLGATGGGGSLWLPVLVAALGALGRRLRRRA